MQFCRRRGLKLCSFAGESVCSFARAAAPAMQIYAGTKVHRESTCVAKLGGHKSALHIEKLCSSTGLLCASAKRVTRDLWGLQVAQRLAVYVNVSCVLQIWDNEL